MCAQADVLITTHHTLRLDVDVLNSAAQWHAVVVDEVGQVRLQQSDGITEHPLMPPTTVWN
jgi:hypothetical protein